MAIPPPEGPLAGCRVLVCRPRPEAQRLQQSLASAGATARVLSLIERRDLPETTAQRALVQNLDQFQHVIAVSPHAARLLLDRIDPWWPQFPVGLNWYGVGAGTTAVFEAAGLTPFKPARGFTSEDLLALPVLQQVEQQRALLARGAHGRELIRDTLSQRGASVTELALYERHCPAVSAGELFDHLGGFSPHAVIALSGETLNNLIALGENSDHNLKQRLLVVPVERIAQQARAAGFQRVCTPEHLADEAIAECIARHLTNTDRAQQSD